MRGNVALGKKKPGNWTIISELKGLRRSSGGEDKIQRRRWEKAGTGGVRNEGGKLK